MDPYSNSRALVGETGVPAKQLLPWPGGARAPGTGPTPSGGGGGLLLLGEACADPQGGGLMTPRLLWHPSWECGRCLATMGGRGQAPGLVPPAPWGAGPHDHLARDTVQLLTRTPLAMPHGGVGGFITHQQVTVLVSHVPGVAPQCFLWCVANTGQ